MADESTFGGQSESAFGAGFSSFGGEPTGSGPGADVPPVSAPSFSAEPVAAPSSEGFGARLARTLGAPQYRAPDPEMSALDQSADTLQQRIKRANDIAANPMLQFFSPEGVAKARDFVPKAAEELQKIRGQQAQIKAGRTQAETLGLHPGDVMDEASQADRVEVAKSRALKGDLRVWKGLHSVDPKAAEAIQDQVFEVAGSHIGKAQYAFDSLAGMQNQGQYNAKLEQLRKDGSLSDLEALGLKVPGSFDAFNGSKAAEGQALRDARIGIDTIRGKLEERNTYQPMEEKEAKTYNGRMTTIYGDQVTNGTWARNASSNVRGLVVNGAADPRDLGKTFTLATPDQRKAIKEEFEGAVPKAEIEKARAFDRTYKLATEDGKGNPVPDGKLNTNPNVQQGVAEGLASMLRGGTGGANVGLLKIELAKRGWAQAAIDGVVSNYAGAMNTLFANANRTDKPYLSEASQRQIREVMDVLKTYNDSSIEDRAGSIAKRAGALGLDPSAFGFGKDESEGVVADAIKAGRNEQIARMLPNHQAIGGGDGVFQLGAQRPGSGATSTPPGTAPATQLPGVQPLQTPVQQAIQPQPAPPAPQPAPVGSPPAPAGGGSPSVPPAPITIAGQQVSVPLPPGASPAYTQATQRIESGKSKNPWTAEVKGPDGKPLSSASGAYQMTDGTWNENKPAGVTAMRAKDATPAQQSEAFATLTAKNGAALKAAGLPVNDTSLYVTHNLGATGGSKLLAADPKADAREVVGERAARNNPLFFRGRPTVEKVLERYNTEMETGLKTTPEGVKPLPGAESPRTAGGGLMDRVRGWLSAGAAPEGSPNPSDASLSPEQRREATLAAAGAAPAALGTVGAVAGGAAAGPLGAAAGGAAGGGAGQVLKDYLRGNPQSPAAIAKEAAFGAVLGIAPVGRPIVGAATRAVGAGTVEGVSEVAGGASAEDALEAGLKTGVAAAGGEAFGRALGMAGHKVFSLFNKDAQAAVQTAAGKFAAAEETLAKEAPTIPGVGGAAATKNPKYLEAEANKLEAERTLKDAGLKPEEAAYAHKVSSEGVPKQEAEAARPGKTEEKEVGKGYEQLRNEMGETGAGAVKPAPKLPDGPIAAAETAKMSPVLKSAAERTEMAITAPAANWRDKWTQLQEARSALLDLSRDAASSTTAGRTQLAKDYRTLADSVRTQQEKAAKYVFGEKDGAAFIARLKVLDVRYRNLMEATNHGDLAKAATLKGEAGREADKKFRAFAHDDPQALAAWDAMRKNRSNIEQGVHDLVAAERIPFLGKVFSAVKLAGSLNQWLRDRAAGSPATFASMLPKLEQDAAAAAKAQRDLLGTAGARGAVAATMQPDDQNKGSVQRFFGGDFGQVADDGKPVGGFEHYKNLRRSDNVEDRRQEGTFNKIMAFIQDTARMPTFDEFKEMAKHPLTKHVSKHNEIPPHSRLSEDAGTRDLEK